MRLGFTLAALVFASPTVARMVDCRIAFKGDTYLSSPCKFGADKDASFTISVSTNKRNFFAYANKKKYGSTEAYLDEENLASHAQTLLGTVR